MADAKPEQLGFSMGGSLLTEEEVKSAARESSRAATATKPAEPKAEPKAKPQAPSEPEKPRETAFQRIQRLPWHPEFQKRCLEKAEQARQRLVKGQANLTKRHDWLLDLPDAGVGRKEEAEFLEWFEKWIHLEYEARILGLDGCIHGKDGRCPDNVVVRCQFCAERD